MAIDGRRMTAGEPAKDAYDSAGVRITAALIVVVPLVALLAFAYWSGTWIGGWKGGVLSVASAGLTVAIVWAYRKRRGVR